MGMSLIGKYEVTNGVHYIYLSDCGQILLSARSHAIGSYYVDIYKNYNLVYHNENSCDNILGLLNLAIGYLK